MPWTSHQREFEWTAVSGAMHVGVVRVGERRENEVPIVLMLREIREERSDYRRIIALGFPVGFGEIRSSEDVVDSDDVAGRAKERRDELLPPVRQGMVGYV